MYYLKPHLEIKVTNKQNKLYKLIDSQREIAEEINEYDLCLFQLISQYSPKELASILEEKESKILDFISHYYIRGYLTSEQDNNSSTDNTSKKSKAINIINKDFNLLLLSLLLIILPLVVLVTTS